MKMETKFEQRLREILTEYPDIDPERAALALRSQPPHPWVNPVPFTMPLFPPNPPRWLPFSDDLPQVRVRVGSPPIAPWWPFPGLVFRENRRLKVG